MIFTKINTYKPQVATQVSWIISVNFKIKIVIDIKIILFCQVILGALELMSDITGVNIIVKGTFTNCEIYI